MFNHVVLNTDTIMSTDVYTVQCTCTVNLKPADSFSVPFPNNHAVHVHKYSTITARNMNVHDVLEYM